MKTSFSRVLSQFIALACAFACFVPSLARSDSATWNLDPVSSDWNTAGNWTPAIVPNGVSDVATLGPTNDASISLSASVTVDSVVFTADAAAYSIAGSPFAFAGGGIVNNSAVSQNFDASQGMAFTGSSSVGSGVIITNNGSPTSGKSIMFSGSANAGSAMLINNGAAAGSNPGVLLFLETSSAGESTIINQSPAGGIAGGEMTFFDTATAGASNITIETGAFVTFEDNSSAGEASILVDGGLLDFEGRSTGGTAAVQMTGAAQLKAQNLFGRLEAVFLGSLAGEGNVILARPLVVGGNGLNTIFTGTFTSLTKSGTLNKAGAGTLTLTGSSTLSSAIVSEGTLVIDNPSGTGTGGGPIEVDAGTLGGNGKLDGHVAIGSGSGPGAFLAPAAGTGKTATLSTTKGLLFQSDGTYTCLFIAQGRKTLNDLVAAKGVTIMSGARFDFAAQVIGRLHPGATFMVINNTSTAPVMGVFDNLQDGSTINFGGNTLQASYEGGDGNDLVLTVLP